MASSSSAPAEQPGAGRRVQVCTPAGEALLSALYDKTVADLRNYFPVECRCVPTRYGTAHVLVAGPETGRPLVVWHGSGYVGPHMLGIMKELVVAGYRVYTPDNPCDSGSRSDPIPIDPANHGWGRWARQVIDSLGLLPDDGDADKAASTSAPVHLGMSFGGGVVLDLMAVAPDAVGAAVLIVPICLDPAYGSFMSTLRLVWQVVLPVMMYRMLPCALTQRWAGSAIMEDPSFIPEQILLTWQHLVFASQPPQLIESGALSGFKGPAIAFFGNKDCFANAMTVERRAHELMRDCHTAVVSMKHAPSLAGMEAIVARALRFLDEKGFGPKLQR